MKTNEKAGPSPKAGDKAVAQPLKKKQPTKMAATQSRKTGGPRTRSSGRATDDIIMYSAVPPEPSNNKSSRRPPSEVFQKAADKLPWYEPPPKRNGSRTHDQEGFQFRKFVKGIKDHASVSKNGRTKFYESDHAIWMGTLCRFTDEAEQTAAIADSPDPRFIENHNGCPSTVTKDMQTVLEKGKPVCVVVGGTLPGRKEWHAQLLAVDWNAKKAWVKDGKKIGQAIAMPPVYEILELLNIPEVQLVGELPPDALAKYTDCLKESYQYAGQLLDGRKPFWEYPYSVLDYSRTYSVPERRTVVCVGGRRK